MDDGLRQRKFEALAGALGENVLRAEAVSSLPGFFPGTTAEEWRSWQAEGFIKMLPGTKKVLLADACEFLATKGTAEAKPVQERMSKKEVDIQELEQQILRSAREMSSKEATIV